MKTCKATFNMPVDIWKQFRAKTILDDTTATKEILKFITEYIKEPNKRTK